MAKKKDEKDLKVGDMLKRLVSLGVGAAFLTEDTVKSVLQEVPLPKDILGGVMQSASKAKDEFSGMVREEVREVLGKVDWSKLLREVLDDYDIEVETKVKFSPKKGPNS